MASIRELVDQIVEDGVMTSEEYDTFLELMHKDGKIDVEESAEISRIFRLIQEGKLRVINEEREAFDKIRSS